MILALSILALSACNRPAGKTESDGQIDKPAIGAQKDEHGCIASTGETGANLSRIVFKFII